MAGKPACPSGRVRPFSAPELLRWAGGKRTVMRYGRGETIFARGDASKHVLFIWSGAVKLSAQSTVGREAVVAVLGPGDFFGEGCLTGQPVRIRSAVAIRTSAVVPVQRRTMARLLQHQQGLSDRFISHVLARNISMEADLCDQLFGAGDVRLARALLQMAHYGDVERPARMVARIPPARLAEIAGTTASLARMCLETFSRQGFIECLDDHRLKINRSLLTVVLRD